MYDFPNFFIVGATKCATTSLMKYLEQHPTIFFCYPKEPEYFSSFYKPFPHAGPGDSRFDDSVIRTEQAYRKLFQSASKYKIIGEASTDYLYYSQTAADIYRSSPQAKILISLRNPVDRAISAYKHLLSQGRETLSFEEGLAAEELRRNYHYRHIWYYKDAGLYHRQVAAYLSVFPHEQVKIILFDEIEQNLHKVLSEIMEFLGLDRNYSFDTSFRSNVSLPPKYVMLENLLNKPSAFKGFVRKTFPPYIYQKLLYRINRWNVRSIKVDISKEAIKYLASYFREDIIKLQPLIGQDLSHWAY
jgi:hypothetical protein